MKFRTIATATAAMLILGPTSLASAAPPTTTPIDGLVGPLHLAVTGKTVSVSESFAGQITTVTRDGADVTYSNPGWDVAGSEYRGSTLFFLESVGAGPDPRPMVGVLKSIDAKGNVTTITDEIAAYEIANNPDADVQYGLSPADAAANPDCVAEMTAIGFPASYTGADVEPDSHAYGLEVVGNTAYVADAGANAVLTVNLKTGEIDTLAVLPAREAVITEAAATAFGIPSCEGLTYAFEAVPTDIEIGPDGWLYVASLPGGPEDDSLGARGAVYRIDPNSGDLELYVEGLLSPTGIALDGSGNLYVASMFGAGILKVASGSLDVSVLVEVPLAADVDVQGNTLYYTYDVFGNGTLDLTRL
ncbi:ScyD/ScyE family protein [Tessaracoccus sp. OS52]|uniref:ScyD/ScyE family protein n=1 Tax=Tessaracoccus sp. OS52 TaxID=2886691 RepID=UPI001D103EC3|nr:ScyD/ScyE family protein [Tessaracoccus sp. OS52]MCC2593605.1 ScyD/ScyE family protein [Tessaracoccus sp. OS52]